ncbi:ribonuclease M, partial [Tothia fuscella]
LSCQNTTAVADSCCFNYPGGSMLQTQFWDTAPATGPSDSWTIHGLWPDHCDGTYDANCDTSRAYTGINTILQSFGATTLLSYMSTYWKDYQGDDNTFWEHEWGKHGTCINTLKPSCYSGYQSKQELVDYFQRTVDLFKALPSYQWLAAAGITPSSTATYTSAQIQSALQSRHGRPVHLGCKSGVLNEIWYYYNVQGSVQSGSFVAANPDGSSSTCPATGVKYLPKSGSGTSTTTTTAGPTGTVTPGTGFSGTGFLNVIRSGATNGCVISAGTWYTTGTCATFTATASGSGFTLSSSKGKCAIVSGALSCASTVTTATVFTASGGNLVNGGGTTFYASAVASGSTQQPIY